MLKRAAAIGLAAAFAVLSATPAQAHGFTSTVYVDVTGDGAGVRTNLELEYDLLFVSAADYLKNDPLFREGDAAFQAGDTAAQATAVNHHIQTITGYVTERFAVTANGRPCESSVAGPMTMGEREGVPYTLLPLIWNCPDAGSHEVRSGLFPASEEYVRDTKTIVTYALDGRTGSAALDAATPQFSTAQAWWQRAWEFLTLGAEHLLSGPDHILFLLALIAGSRRLREIVLAASAFTVAHSVTFLLAALGLVHVPASIVEPIIAASIAVVAAWHLVRLARRRDHADDLEAGSRGLDRAGWLRIAIVFAFGLIHGLGFAGALGIQEAWSWTLLWSLLVFNVGIELVQLAGIALLFPVLALLRKRSPRAGAWSTGVISAGVAAMGLVWLVQRVTDL
ncbi:HupE/UreJ family protein [Catenuloplanes japonicus]|uniref:HupE/UreJ family protein n=1 Tax=Catenuloplanes japonicus TaxID=33876 RepID=UPI0005259C8B|nr:HupE/UreJ family protein [Catenuloplanes japonicus]